MRSLPPGPSVVGIVNLTPDSFSDGGLHDDPERAVAHGLRLVAEGAGALDVGAESTRPGATPVGPAEERARLLGPLRALRAATDVPLSVDTRNASTAAAAVAAGADVLNDVSGLRHDPDLARVAAESGATLVLMHSRGCPATMRDLARYADVTAEVSDELARSVDVALAAGCAEERLVLDPGFGFAKTPEQSLELLARLDDLLALGRPLLVGLSRKSVIARILAPDAPAPAVSERVHASIGAGLAAVARGASWLRVHDVRPTVEALSAWTAVRSAGRHLAASG